MNNFNNLRKLFTYFITLLFLAFCGLCFQYLLISHFYMQAYSSFIVSNILSIGIRYLLINEHSNKKTSIVSIYIYYTFHLFVFLFCTLSIFIFENYINAFNIFIFIILVYVFRMALNIVYDWTYLIRA